MKCERISGKTQGSGSAAGSFLNKMSSLKHSGTVRRANSGIPLQSGAILDKEHEFCVFQKVDLMYKFLLKANNR